MLETEMVIEENLKFCSLVEIESLKTQYYLCVFFRMALDDKLYQRDLEVALALSVKELPTVTIDAEDCQDKSNFIFCIFIFKTFLLLLK